MQLPADVDASDLASLLQTFSYPAVFLLLVACGLGAPLSEDLILVTAGVLASKGSAYLGLIIPVAYAGVVLGDSLLFRIGRKLGPRICEHPRLSKALTPARVSRVKGMFAKRGLAAIFLARFVPGLRAPSFLIAGMGEVPLRRFLLADGLAAMLWVPLMTYLGYRFGLVVLRDVEVAARWMLSAVGVAALVVLARSLWRRRAAEGQRV